MVAERAKSQTGVQWTVALVLAAVPNKGGQVHPIELVTVVLVVAVAGVHPVLPSLVMEVLVVAVAALLVPVPPVELEVMAVVAVALVAAELRELAVLPQSFSTIERKCDEHSRRSFCLPFR
jgi:hypothetical protein